MPVYGASDIQPALDLSGVPMTVGLVTANVFEDAPDDRLLQGEFTSYQGRHRAVLAKTGVFALAIGAVAVVSSISYKIAGFDELDDGGMTKVALVVVA